LPGFGSPTPPQKCKWGVWGVFYNPPLRTYKLKNQQLTKNKLNPFIMCGEFFLFARHLSAISSELARNLQA
jgi:hypothetical protein